MSDHDKLTDEQLVRERDAERAVNDRIRLALEIPDGIAVDDAVIGLTTRLKAELRELRKLRDEIEPALRRYLSSHDNDYRNELPKCRCDTCAKARDILARHFGKEQEK